MDASGSGGDICVSGNPPGSYKIYRDDNPVGEETSPTTSFLDDSLTAGIIYTYTVRAKDTSGNLSLPSDPASATPRDLTIPVPGYLTAVFEVDEIVVVNHEKIA